MRVGADGYTAALARPFTRHFDITGKPMAGWVMVEREGYEADEDLKRWVGQGLEFALSLPAKAPGGKGKQVKS